MANGLDVLLLEARHLAEIRAGVHLKHLAQVATLVRLLLIVNDAPD